MCFLGGDIAILPQHPLTWSSSSPLGCGILLAFRGAVPLSSDQRNLFSVQLHGRSVLGQKRNTPRRRVRFSRGSGNQCSQAR
jgi:hypothetical protein